MTVGRATDLWRTEGAGLALAAVATLFGVQSLRILMSTIVHVLGDRFEVSLVNLGLFAFLPFLAAFLAGVFWRVLGSRGAMIVTAGGLGVARMTEQASADPVVDLGISAVGVALLMLFLPIYLGRIRGGGPAETGRMGLAILLGLAADSGIHGVVGTYDLSWQSGPGPLIFVAALLAILLVALAQSAAGGSDGDGSDARWAASWPLLAIGPFLFLEALLFQNQAQAAALTGWILPGAFLWVVVVNLVGLAASVLIVETGWFRLGWVALAAGGLLVAVLVAWPAEGLVAAGALLVGHIASASLLIGILTSTGDVEGRPGLSRTTLALGVGAVLFVALSFAYYTVYQISVPYENTVVPVVAAVLIALAGVGASFRLARGRSRVSLGGSAVWLSAVVVILPFFSLGTWKSTVPRPGTGWPVRVMTYNLHMGFDTDGRLGLEALAQVMEESGADVLALQEVSRGWLVNGSADMLSWLSQRLDMSYVWNPTADPLWGNAIFSRFPIDREGTAALPRGGVPLKRGYAWARIDIGGGETLLFIGTHLHHVEEEGEVRLLQVQPLVEEIERFSFGPQGAVLLGDLNAEPDSPEIERIRRTGFLDAFAELGTGEGYTFSSFDPWQRIDYIWHSPDLVASDLEIPQSTASDHLGVVVTLDR